MTKDELRKRFLSIRKAASCREADMRITEKLNNIPQINNADTVLLFASYGSEPSTWLIAPLLLEKNIPTAYPKCGENGEMTFYKVHSTKELHIGKFGIAEPAGSIAEIPSITDKTVCIVPGIAFTEDGRRIGYGGGYYDRFLSKYPNLYTIGIAYEKCITDDLPSMEHDIKIKAIVTEERMVLCNE